jgi:hypothetical protein
MEVLACVTDDDYDAWRRVRIAVIAGERCDTHRRRFRHGMTEIYTWTQAGNTSMLRLNEHLGYVTGKTSITLSRSCRCDPISSVVWSRQRDRVTTTPSGPRLTRQTRPAPATSPSGSSVVHSSRAIPAATIPDSTAATSRDTFPH